MKRITEQAGMQTSFSSLRKYTMFSSDIWTSQQTVNVEAKFIDQTISMNSITTKRRQTKNPPHLIKYGIQTH